MVLKSKQRRYRCQRCGGQASSFPPPRAYLSIRHTSHVSWSPSVLARWFMADHRKPTSGKVRLTLSAPPDGGSPHRVSPLSYHQTSQSGGTPAVASPLDRKSVV